MAFRVRVTYLYLIAVWLRDSHFTSLYLSTHLIYSSVNKCTNSSTCFVGFSQRTLHLCDNAHKILTPKPSTQWVCGKSWVPSSLEIFIKHHVSSPALLDVASLSGPGSVPSGGGRWSCPKAVSMLGSDEGGKRANVVSPPTLGEREINGWG